MTTSPADDKEDDIFQMEEDKMVENSRLPKFLPAMSSGRLPTDGLVGSSMDAKMDGTGLQCKIPRQSDRTDSPFDTLIGICIALRQSGHDAQVASPCPYPMRRGTLTAAANEAPLYNTTYTCSFLPYIVIMQQPPPASFSLSTSAPPASGMSAELSSLLYGNGVGVGGNAASCGPVFSVNSVGGSSNMSSSDCASRSSGGGSTGSTNCSSEDEGCEDFWVVETNLRDLFRVAPATEEYNALLSRVPQVWVGPRSSLLKIAERMCDEIEANFLFQSHHDRDVPPWRRLDAFKRRWDLGSCTLDRPPLLASPPLSPRTTPRQPLPLTALHLQQLLIAAGQDLMPHNVFGDRDRSSTSSIHSGTNGADFPAYSEMLSAPVYPVFPVASLAQEASVTTTCHLAWDEADNVHYARHTSPLPVQANTASCSHTRCFSQSFVF